MVHVQFLVDGVAPMFLDVFGPAEQRRPLMRTCPRPRTGYPRMWTGTFFLAGLLTALGWSSSAFAVNRYVNPTGTGGSPCNAANPCPTIKDAVDASNAALGVGGPDVIHVAGAPPPVPLVYNENGLTISVELSNDLGRAHDPGRRSGPIHHGRPAQ